MDYFPALSVFPFVVSLLSSILDWSFLKCLRNGREADLVQTDCSREPASGSGRWVGAGRRPPCMAGRCQPSKQAESGSAHDLEFNDRVYTYVFGLVPRVQVVKESKELWKGNRLD